MLRSLKRIFGGNPSLDRPSAAADSFSAHLRADLQHIVPMIKEANAPDSRTAEVPELRLSFEDSPAAFPFAADMMVMYAIDRPNHLEYISNRALAHLGLTIDQLHDRAIQNLPSHLGEVRLHDCGSGMYGLSAGGTFEASLLLLDDLWLQLADRLPGEPLAAAQSRDLLIVIGSASPNDTEVIGRQARIDLPEKRYAISTAVLIRRAGKWQADAS